MNPRVLIVVALALVCGVSAMLLVKALRNPTAAPTVERTGVVFATADVAAGEALGESQMEVRQIPVEDLPEDAIRKVADALERAARGPIDKGDMLRDRKLAARGAGRGMAALIPPGMRAYNIATPTAASSLAGSLRPRDKVDVLLTATSTEAASTDQSRATTSALLQNIEVLEVHGPPAPASGGLVGGSAGTRSGPTEIQSVTLLVSPENALELDSGRNRGTLQLTLRNPIDKEVRVTRPAVAVAAPAPPPPPKPRPLKPGGIATIELARTLRGTQVGRSTLKLRIPDHETLVGYTVTTAHGTYQLDDSITLEPDPNSKPSVNPLGNPFEDARTQLTSISGPKPATP